MSRKILVSLVLHPDTIAMLEAYRDQMIENNKNNPKMKFTKTAVFEQSIEEADPEITATEMMSARDAGENCSFRISPRLHQKLHSMAAEIETPPYVLARTLMHHYLQKKTPAKE